MIEARMLPTVGGEWLSLQPIPVGPIPSGRGTPDLYVTVSRHGAAIARIDVYAVPEHDPAFQDRP